MRARTTSLPGAKKSRTRSPRFRAGGLGALAIGAGLALAGCGGAEGEDEAGAAEPITLYTCSSDETVQPLIAEFEDANPGARVELFRAPTGELNARVASDIRSGGLRADVIWGCDPLTMQSFVDQDLVGGWVPDNASGIPDNLRTDDYVGAHVLYMVAIHHTDAPAPQTWRDLASGEYEVAVPDPAVAASALGTLGYFAQSPDLGMELYEDLKSNGAVQVSTPDEVTIGVAQGVYDAGVTIATSAYQAKEDGSPIDVVWPEPGAVAVYGPVALAKESSGSQTAKDFISFVVGEEGQTTVAESGSYPAMRDVDGPTVPDGAPVVFPDWAAIGQDKDTLLSEYQKLFGG
jgi:iron(III) transport system substrate-binding protein